ncbi:MAG TPA: hypothetical protein VNW90_17125 [Acetobacteraceae bacterium]|nr:hypothetical protein [Acetobacteraceae bacterium]
MLFCTLAAVNLGTPSFLTIGGDTAAGIDARSSQYAGGMKCDGATNDTAALQAAAIAGDMNHGARRVLIPPGDCKFTGITVHAPVTVQCAGRNATTLDLIPGTANAYVTIAITSTDVPVAPPGNFAYVDFIECQLTSASNADGPGQGTAHGFYVKGLTNPTPATVVVELIRDKIANVPGDCVHYDQTGGGLSWKGNFKGEGSTCEQPGGNGLSCNSGSDWQWWEGQVWGATLNNFQFSGCSNMQIHGVNTFSALLADISLFNSDMQWIGGVIDTTGTDNIVVGNSGGQPVDIIGAFIRQPGQTATNSYSNFRFQVTNTGSVYCTGCRITNPDTALPNGNTPLKVANFVAGNTGQLIIDGTSRVEGQDWLAAAVSNAPDSIMSATGRTNWPRQIAIESNTQFDGFVVRSQSGGSTWLPVAKLMGSDANNDAGAVQMLTNNAIRGFLTSSGESFLPSFGTGFDNPGIPSTAMGLTKMAADSAAPGAGVLKLEATAGTNAGTCKIIAYAGTSATPVTIADNVGSGC